MRDHIPTALVFGIAGFVRSAINRAPDNIAGVRSLVTPQGVGRVAAAIVSFGAFVACLNSGSGNAEERSFLDTHPNGNFAHDTLFGAGLGSLLASVAFAVGALGIFAFASTANGVDGFRRAIDYAFNHPGSASIAGLDGALRRMNDNRDDLPLNLAITNTIAMAVFLLVDHEMNRHNRTPTPLLLRMSLGVFAVEMLRRATATISYERFDRMDEQFIIAFNQLPLDVRRLVAGFVGRGFRIEEPSQEVREDLGRFQRLGIANLFSRFQRIIFGDRQQLREGEEEERLLPPPGNSPLPRTIGNISDELPPNQTNQIGSLV
jgi:hypothetical protein